MKIRRLRLKNFRKISSIPDPTIELNPDINVLVGANNTGKTSILRAIQIILNSTEIIVERDLNYLIQDGNLGFEADLIFSKEQWQSFARLVLDDMIPAQKETVDISAIIERVFEKEVNLRKQVSYLGRNENSESRSALFKDGTPLNPNVELNGWGITNVILNNLAYSNFFNIYNTPLYLDSKGQLPIIEKFIPYNQLVGGSGKNSDKIRAQLYFLKRNTPEEFDGFKKSLLNIFAELEDLDIIHNEEVGEFQLVLTEKLKVNGNTSEVNYDINNVGQGMQTLVAMLSNILLKKPDIVLMDEPEVHMHPSLIKEFIKYIKRLSTETQFIITTHSVVLMQEVGLDKIFALKNDINQKGIVVSKVDDRNQLFETLNALGYDVDALTYTIKPSVFVFTEGPSDKDLILSFANKANLSAQINALNTAFISLDGKGNRYKLAGLIDKLNKEFIDSPLIMILDKDETEQSTIEEIREKFFAQNPKRLHYLSKRQIENYLLSKQAIRKVVLNKIKDEKVLDAWKNENLDARIIVFAEHQKDKILNNYLAELFINESLINTRHLGEILKLLSDKPLNKSVSEFTGEIFKLVGTRTFELGQKSNSAIQEFDIKWAIDKVEMCDERDLLKAIRRWVSDEYKVSFSNDELINAMDAIPDEINSLLFQLTKPEELKIDAQ